MIKLVCNDQLFYKTISNYLLQKNIIVTSTNQKHQIVIDIKDNQNVSKIDINGYKTEISLPIDINVLNSQILTLTHLILQN